MTKKEIGKGIRIDSSSWRSKLSVVMDEFVRSDRPTRETFIDVLWNSAILDRIAPIDPEVAVLRKSEERAVFDGGRGNPELYWRIMYAAAGCIENIRMNTTLICAPDNYVAAIYPELYRLSDTNALRGMYPDLQRRAVDVTGDIILLAKTEIIKATGYSESLAGHPLRYGAEGEWRGMNVRVDGFTSEGTVVFRTANIEDRARIYIESNNGGTVFPWTVDPRMFKPALRNSTSSS